MIHGELAAQDAASSAQALFNGSEGDSAIPTTYINASDLVDGVSIIDTLLLCGLCITKSEARRLIQQNGLAVNSVKIADLSHKLSLGDFSHGKAIFKKGKKDYHALKAN